MKKFNPYDLIFVDASHEYKDVKRDLNYYSKLLSKNGILITHDIRRPIYSGVEKAWDEFKHNKNFLFKEIVCKKYFFVCGFGIAIKK